MKSIQGVPVSPGIAIGRAFIKKSLTKEPVRSSRLDAKDEKKRFHEARELAVSQVEEIHQDMLQTGKASEAAIFLSHIEMLRDPELTRSVEGTLESLDCTAEWAVKTVRDDLVTMFEEMDNDYMRERAMDIKDICGRILGILQGIDRDTSIPVAPSVLIADDLTPSDTAGMKPELVLGIINETGGATSHAAILARMLDIPFLIYPGITGLVQEGQLLAFDGESGAIELEPREEVLQEYKHRQVQCSLRKRQLEKLIGTQTITKDGYKLSLAANIGACQDTDQVIAQDGEGIGLFRTEFLYMNRQDAPSEEEQFSAYKFVAQRMKGKPVIIRTLDIGGDKEVDYLKIAKEDNPFLGYRAIRLCLDRIDFWKVQLRAVLRASAFGNIHLMFPMISSYQELMQAKRLLKEVMEQLCREEIAFNERLPIGMMMETPAAAILSDTFAKEVDFFSIGTNDLIQYTMAADRMNNRVSYLYSPYDPAVLRLMNTIVEHAHKNGIWVGICGEAAAEPALLPAWLGMGVDELSVAPGAILSLREQIQSLDTSDCKELLQQLLLSRDAGENERKLNKRQLI